MTPLYRCQAHPSLFAVFRSRQSCSRSTGVRVLRNAVEDPPRMATQRQIRFDLAAAALQPADVVPGSRAAEYPTVHSAPTQRQIRAARTWRRCVFVDADSAP